MIDNFILVPTYFTLYLKTIHQKDNTQFNISVVIYIRIAYQHMLDNLEDYKFNIDYKKDKKNVCHQIEELLCNPEMRINERPCLDFKDYQIGREDLYSRDKIKVGKILEYRMDFENININVHEDLKQYPFDVQSLKLRIEFTSKEYLSNIFRYNCHNCIPTKNYIFGIYESPNLDNMDLFNLYKNKRGYSYKVCREEKKYKLNGEDKKCYYYPIIEYYIRMWRDPGYCFKVAILPMIILVFFASGVNYFGTLDVQYESLLVFYLSFLSFMQVANSGIQKTNTIHLVDRVIITSYILTLLQYLILILNRFPYFLTDDIESACVPNNDVMPWSIDPQSEYRDTCICNVILDDDSKRINALAMASAFIRFESSSKITLQMHVSRYSLCGSIDHGITSLFGTHADSISSVRKYGNLFRIRIKYCSRVRMYDVMITLSTRWIVFVFWMPEFATCMKDRKLSYNTSRDSYWTSSVPNYFTPLAKNTRMIIGRMATLKQYPGSRHILIYYSIIGYYYHFLSSPFSLYFFSSRHTFYLYPLLFFYRLNKSMLSRFGLSYIPKIYFLVGMQL
eukprot:Mrub_01414.p2 GENE.Mrub_01414~~Mrub_01414.p2  ORF type:complete len:570 (-),score=45.28 Mrub_01414:485-2173(-)